VVKIKFYLAVLWLYIGLLLRKNRAIAYNCDYDNDNDNDNDDDDDSMMLKRPGVNYAPKR